MPRIEADVGAAVEAMYHRAFSNTLADVICTACRERQHDECAGGSWCDCQHLPPLRPAEPMLSWVRQG
jgi:hypothetical protein